MATRTIVIIEGCAGTHAQGRDEGVEGLRGYLGDITITIGAEVVRSTRYLPKHASD